MADIFISYASEDRERVRVLVEALEAEGFSVWWDTHIDLGATYDEVIEHELEAAKAAVVVWTATSKKSRWVRSEATRAERLEKLIPIMLDQNALPLQYELVQTVDFIDWRGDKAQQCWKRLLVKAYNLVGEPENRPLSHPVPAFAEPLPKDHGGFSLTLLLGMIFIGAFMGALSSGSVIMGGSFAIAGAFFMLFRAADTQLPIHLKAIAEQWLLPRQDGLKVNVAEAFNTLFEAVFGPRHFAWRCFFPSALASTFFLFAFLCFALLFVPSIRATFEEEFGSFLVVLTLQVALANIFSDFISLYQTRVFLRWAIRAPNVLALVGLVVADAILTLSIYLGALYGLLVGLQLVGNLMGYGGASPPSFVGFYQGLIPQLTSGSGADLWARSWVLIFSVLTTFITSVWLWLVLLSGPVAKVTVNGRGGVSWIGRLMQVERVPFTVFGMMTAALVIVVAVPISMFWPRIELAFGLNQGPEVVRVLQVDPAEQALWAQTQATDTIEAYDAYLKSYPKGSFTELATTRTASLREIAKAEREAAEQAKTEADRQKAQADEAAWKVAQAKETPEGFEAYLVAFPNGLFSDAANAELARLKAEAEEAKNRSTTAAGRFEAGQVFRDCKDCPELVVVPAGRFTMGSPPGVGDTDERPQQTITIAQPLAVGRYEVTFAEWDACASDRGGCSKKPDDRGWGRGRRPVINVAWNDAQEYVRWLTSKTGQEYRLLTEAEWEYAARAGTKTSYSTGETISSSQANFHGDNPLGQTVAVGSYKPNGFGLYDMHGNVWEWVEDCYRGSLDGQPADGSAVVTPGCGQRVLRGGSWGDYPEGLRSANRDWVNPSFGIDIIGFRVARTLSPPTP